MSDTMSDWIVHFRSALQTTAGGQYTSAAVPVRRAAEIADRAMLVTRKRAKQVPTAGEFPPAETVRQAATLADNAVLSIEQSGRERSRFAGQGPSP